ncbi:hypothetical protein FOL47_006662 [Perkinsus chesapeaki]|uniref:Uncharacterized protein n=1 Tax=Perkinsus chesapeaki TaxID=330153 RepID=A0A7J6LQJ6_PERCH|nr:hypothetical protein FOL47_006662 [Perkinsus chesapeaki]
MVVFSSKHWRNLTNTVMGVQAITSDPLESRRKQLADYTGRVQALHQHIVRLLSITDQLIQSHDDLIKDMNLIMGCSSTEDVTKEQKAPSDEVGVWELEREWWEYRLKMRKGETLIFQNARAISLFEDRLGEFNKMARDARPQLEKARNEAQELVRRTGDLQEKLKSRDRAYEELNHYNQKVTDLKAEMAKKSKPDVKEQERLDRNVDKHRIAQENFTKLDGEVRSEMAVVVDSKVVDIARVVAEYSRYLGTVGSAGVKDNNVFRQDIPNMVKDSAAKENIAEGNANEGNAAAYPHLPPPS